MGLEVGWNCHISLAPQPPSLREEATCDENDDSDNQEGGSYFLIKIISSYL